MQKPLIGMVRGVNVGGKMLKMELLRTICSDLGYSNVQTLLNSGNVVFRGGNADAKTIEEALKNKAKLDVRVFLRTPAEMRKAIAANPFPEAAKNDPGHLIVMFLEKKPSLEAQRALRDAYTGPEPMHFAGRELFIHYVEGQGRSKLSLSLIERKLGMTATARNWNTVLKLRDLASQI